MQITFVTSNENKYKELLKGSNFDFKWQKLDLQKIQSLSLEKIAINKAYQAYDILKVPVLIEESSLRIDFLNKMPGPFIKWFLQEMSLQEICNLIPSTASRKAISEIIYVLYNGKKVRVFYGQTKGVISKKPLGNNFGWDPIFKPNNSKKTWAEMNTKERKKTSMRKKALVQLDNYLTTRK